MINLHITDPNVKDMSGGIYYLSTQYARILSVVVISYALTPDSSTLEREESVR